MAEQLEKDGKKFWRFPALPYEVGNQVRALYNYYIRTNPETGLVELDKWAVYPNNSTPRTLGPLLDLLLAITVENGFAMLGNDNDQLRDNHNRWATRLQFYRDKVAELALTGPDTPVGGSSPVSKELARYVVEPLFLGWYPHDVAPFSEQPPPYSSQIQQSLLDLYSPYTIANQLAISGETLATKYANFKKDLADSTDEFFNDTLPNLPGLNVLPYVIAGAIGLGIFTWIKK